MKRKTIIKFVSLLGVGSFVMLAAASCTQAISLIPNSGSTSTNPNSTNNSRVMANTTPNENPITPPTSGAEMSNPSAGGGAETDNVDQQLASARKSLTDFLDNESKNLAIYSDYANIQKFLTSAYDTAKTASQNTNASLDDLRSITTTLQSAIDKARNDKQTFDSANQPLVTAYNQLKATLQSNTNPLEGLDVDKYSAIKNKVSEVFTTGNGIISMKLDSFMTTDLTAQTINKANEDIRDVITKLPGWKTNADEFDNFKNNPLSKTQLTSMSESTQTQDQPSNWSFTAYSVDIPSTGSTSLQNLSFVQRKVWSSNGGITSLVTNPVISTDVSWIYSLAGEGTKYTLRFTYYGPSTAYLYFPYKLVKSADMSNVALQYKLNEAPTPTPVTFGSEATANGPTPTVNNINVAKITLTGLNFGDNTIEFSLPTGESKVAPMIGNMYISSNSDSQQKITNQIFGNTNDNPNSVTVDLLKGYGLTAGWSTYVGQFQNLLSSDPMNTGQRLSAPSYLVGLIAGSSERTLASNVAGPIKSPSARTTNRTYTIFVNAPAAGHYYISGSYITTNSQARTLKFQSEEQSSSVSISARSRTSFTTLEKFDTSVDTTYSNVGTNGNRTLQLKDGVNKIVISGDGDTPFIGNLTFTLNSDMSNGSSENQNPPAM
ncbi:FIVAR domain-containing protein [Mycoplasma tullyi]|uniref:FIVAR domain-containing protein n=1 Tax=Mycoplasma tullyi TaxID=1612150 RepID=A0A7D7U2Z8_9MOLU|nr:FIVAR domain-containing protein [Mycoplasma tullyi]QMT98270.1 FIVAR domain-containing protein [Mycoplasma tullyi]